MYHLGQNNDPYNVEVNLRHFILPVGSYHTPFLGYPTLWFWDPNPKIRQPKKGVWYKPTGIAKFGI